MWSLNLEVNSTWIDERSKRSRPRWYVKISTSTTKQLFVAQMEKYGKLVADRLLFPAVSPQPGINILIRSEQMYGFLTGEVTRSKTCSTNLALNTKLG